jgi:hypothetical protein
LDGDGASGGRDAGIASGVAEDAAGGGGDRADDDDGGEGDGAAPGDGDGAFPAWARPGVLDGVDAFDAPEDTTM